jgi:hypothetical protein
MVTSILTVMVYIGAVLAIVLLLALFSPFVLKTEFAVSSESQQGSVFLSWLHPLVVAARFSSVDGKGEVRLFGWRITVMKREAHDGTGTGGQDRAGTAPPAAAAPIPRQQTESVMPKTAPEPSPQASPHVSRKDDDIHANTNTTTGTHEETRAASGQAQGRFRRFRNTLASGWRKAETTWRVIRFHRMASRFTRWMLSLFSGMLGIIRFDLCRLHVRAGIDDPADLGKVYGWYTAVQSIIRRRGRRIFITFEPRFMQNTLAFDGVIGLRTSLARILTPVTVALFTFPWLRAFFVWRRLRKLYRSTGENGTIG